MITSSSSCSRDILLLQLRMQPSEKMFCFLVLSVYQVPCISCDSIL